MQYILNEEEMEEIRHLRRKFYDLPGRDDHLEALKNVCKMVATTMIPTGWTSFASRRLADGSTAEWTKPHGCIYNEHANKASYCDRCPVQGICPMPKDYSK